MEGMKTIPLETLRINLSRELSNLSESIEVTKRKKPIAYITKELMKAEIKPRIDFEGRTKLETVIPLSTPYLVFLDPSDICNANCQWCPTGSKEALKYKKPQLMDFDLYQKIIDDLSSMPEPIKTLRLYKDGEPLLHPKFPEMVLYAKESGRFGQVDTTTNGSLLRPTLNIQIIKAGLDKMFVSVPTEYSPAYVKNVKHFYDNSRDKCQVYVKTIGDDMTEGTKVKFMKDFGDISDRIFIEHLSPCWPEFDVKGVQKEIGIYGQEIKEVQVCSYLFYSLSINSDGTVSACFLDWKHSMLLGDLKKESFKSIWNGKLLRDYRIMHLTKARSLLRMCGVCQQLAYGACDDIDAYAEEILGRME
jgi:MoaA/NifB/PqqE/SkfB family radical SAM enzyme